MIKESKEMELAFLFSPPTGFTEMEASLGSSLIFLGNPEGHIIIYH
jgi:hypothetical protein